MPAGWKPALQRLLTRRDRFSLRLPPCIIHPFGMCLIALAWRMRADLPLVVAANRDEFYDRPTRPAHV